MLIPGRKFAPENDFPNSSLQLKARATIYPGGIWALTLTRFRPLLGAL